MVDRAVTRDREIQFRGMKGGLLVRFDEGEDFGLLKERLADKLDSAQKFFHGSTITIDVGNRILTSQQLLELEALFSTRYGVRVLQVVNGGADAAMDGWGGEEGAAPVPPRPDEIRPRLEARGVAVCLSPPEEVWVGETQLIRRTVRSGQRISYNGNIVVLGDVNPGAEVVASGDVIVLGALRGVVHAGATGNEEAVVLAFRLRPTQLRIGNVIGRSPDWEPEGAPELPEIAWVKAGEIVIDLYNAGGRPEEARLS